MSFFEIAIFLLFLATIAVPLAAKTHFPYEIFLVAASAVISLIPGLTRIEIDPKIVFNLFLPPIIFSAAYFVSWHDFKFNLRPITLLAFGLTIATALVVALIAVICIPGFNWKEGFLLGAIVSPTDATSAIAVVRKLGAPRRLIAVLEGESMINDATALVMFRFSIAAIMLNSFSIHAIATQLVVITVGGSLIGLIIGIITIYFLHNLEDVKAETTFTFITAFGSYLIAERLGFSGVISTVVCGIYTGIRFHDFSNSSTRMNTKANWQTLIFIINCFAFTLIGIELPGVIRNLEPYHIPELVVYSVVVTVMIMLTRIAWTYGVAYFSRLLIPSIALKDPMPSWKLLFVLSWASMRGIISLAAVLAIPIYMSKGILFPHRNMIIFITYCVIVLTLVIPTITLPFLIKIFNLGENQHERIKEEALARIRSLEGVIDRLKNVVVQENIPKNIFHEFRDQFQRRLQMVQTQLDDIPFSTLNDDYSALRKLTLAAIVNERETLMALRKSGEIHNEVFHRLSDELDLEEIRAKSLRL